MRIKGPVELVKRAKFVAQLLELDGERLHIHWAPDGETSYLDANHDGTFDLYVQNNILKHRWVAHIGHEMTHMRQVIQGRLRFTSDDTVLWDGVEYSVGAPESDEYFFTPWEMEARAMEGWVIHRWMNR